VDIERLARVGYEAWMGFADSERSGSVSKWGVLDESTKDLYRRVASAIVDRMKLWRESPPTVSELATSGYDAWNEWDVTHRPKAPRLLPWDRLGPETRKHYLRMAEEIQKVVLESRA
jgi:hypothetical protein